MNSESVVADIDVRPVVGIFGHYGNENLGDEAIIEALIARIRAERPDADIRCFSIHPSDSRQRYGVAAYPIRAAGEAELRHQDWKYAAGALASSAQPSHRAAAPPANLSRLDRIKTSLPHRLRALLGSLARAPLAARDMVGEIAFLIRSYRRLRGVHALVIAGSNQFLDNFGGPWGFPYTLLKWSVLARLVNCRLLYVSVGAGPLDARLSRLMVRSAIRLAHYMSFRDAASERLVLGGRTCRSDGVYPDLAHSLAPHPHAPSAADGGAGHRKPVVGINPMPLFDERYWYASDGGLYRTYVLRLAEFAEYLIDLGYPVFLFPTQTKDLNVVKDITQTMRPQAAARLIHSEPDRRLRTVDELMQTIHGADIVVATRFHGTLLALHARRPVLAICYYRKTRDLMREMEQDAYAIDFDKLDMSELIDRFHRLEANRQHAAAQIAAVDDRYVARLEQQYRQILPIVFNEKWSAADMVRQG